MKSFIKLFAIPFITTLFILSPAHSAVFNPGNVADLISAIQTANGNMEDDVINLVPGMVYTITAGAGGGPFNNGAGNNGLPIIEPDDGSSITIIGNGATIQRDPALFTTEPCDSDPPLRFRIFQVNSGSDLLLTGLTIQNGCTSLGGIATDGGGIMNFGTMTITNSAVLDNQAFNNGGGIVNFNATATITNTTIAGNLAGNNGGGILNGNGTVFVTNVTIVENEADDGGGIDNDSSGGQTAVVELKNTLIVSNTAEEDDNNCTGDTPTDNGGNISDDDTDDCAFAFNPNWNTATMLGPLQDNGGGTPTRALIPAMGPSNPALDTIAPANCTDQQMMPQPVTDDQRFFPRPFPPGGNCDVGAFELQPTGILTIENKVEPPSGQRFEFSGAPFPPDCGLDGIFFMRQNDSISCLVPFGVYTIAENVPPGFALDISCTEVPSFMTPTSVTVEIIGGDDFVCTFTNLGLEIILTPEEATNEIPSEHTVTASVLIGGLPAEGELVEFEVTSGPNEGEMSDPGEGECVPNDCVTDESGNVSWTYAGELLGTDTITASFFTEEFEMTVESNTVNKTWIVVRNIPTLSEWGLIAMAAVLGMIGVYVMRRRVRRQGA